MTRSKVIAWLAMPALLCGCGQSPTPAMPTKVTPKQEAAEAVQRQDYASAERLYRPLAEQGDASAQHFLGKMYQSGEGVRRDPVEAAKWFRLAADQGHTGAQFYLAEMYASGNGVTQDYVQAYMWFDLSTSGPQAFYAVAGRSEAADKMTPAQIIEAQRLASAWRSKRAGQR